MHAALERAATTDPATALRLVDGLTLFWLFAGHYREGDNAYARALDAAGEEPTPLRGRVLAGRGYLALFGGGHEAAYRWAQAALATGEACGDLCAQGRAYHTLGLMVSYRDPAGGRPLLERSVELATQAGDDWCQTSALQILAIGWIFQDEFDTGRQVLDAAYATATRLGYRRGFAWHWFCLGLEATLHGRLDEARELLARALAVSDEVGDPVTNGFANSLMAYTQLAGGDTKLAYSLANTTLARVLAHVPETNVSLAGMAYQISGQNRSRAGRAPRGTRAP